MGEARSAIQPKKHLKREYADWATGWQSEMWVGKSSKVFVVPRKSSMPMSWTSEWSAQQCCRVEGILQGLSQRALVAPGGGHGTARSSEVGLHSVLHAHGPHVSLAGHRQGAECGRSVL